jgi:hypothetical protein
MSIKKCFRLDIKSIFFLDKKNIKKKMSIYRTRNSEISMKGVRNSISEILPNKGAVVIERSKFEQSQVCFKKIKKYLE